MDKGDGETGRQQRTKPRSDSSEGEAMDATEERNAEAGKQPDSTSFLK